MIKTEKNFIKNEEPFVKRTQRKNFFFHFRANLYKSQILLSKGNFFTKNSN